jgi:hypothetical protein
MGINAEMLFYVRGLLSSEQFTLTHIFSYAPYNYKRGLRVKPAVTIVGIDAL